MQGSRRLLFFSALLLLGFTTALATHSDEFEESMQENEIDRDTSDPKNDLDLHSIKKLIYADENRHRELVTLPEESDESQVRTKRGLRRVRQKLKNIEEKTKAQVQRIIGKPGSKRRKAIERVISRIRVKGEVKISTK
ncbi:hypothetical protein B566_EDAN009593 [Ephemera danica]|nr:hypothetical protein B566_EDAN009593 [Ephemera danica]